MPLEEVVEIPLLTEADSVGLPELDKPLTAQVRNARLLDDVPWVRALGKLAMEVASESWRFPVPEEPKGERRTPVRAGSVSEGLLPRLASAPDRPSRKTRLKPPEEVVILKERLLYLLQPPLEDFFAGRQVTLPCQPYGYQMEGIAFLMPRWSALLADEMGLGKTMQAIVALRLLFQAGLAKRALIVCPKPLVPNWARELRNWAPDLPFEIIGGDTNARRCGWLVSNCPVKLVNYELLTRDAEYLQGVGSGEWGVGSRRRTAQLPTPRSPLPTRFDVVILDEAQRIKNRDAKTAQAVRDIPRERSWALTGTPVENRAEDLINLFAFIKPGHVPVDTSPKRLPELTRDCILRRCKEDVLSDLPPKVIRDAYIELSPAQRKAYALAEKEGLVRLNALGETITVQHVFELIMRLKQICNFDPFTGHSSKLDQLRADLAEVAESGRKAILFSQWVEPLEWLAGRLACYGPLSFHGRIPPHRRQENLHAFQHDSQKHILLMSYGTGGVGLNLQFANYVFLFDRWWNPAVEDQAINRTHRIGQTETVFVTRFVTPNTIEGRIVEVLEKKRQMFCDLMDQHGSPPSLGLSEEEIFGLFDLRVRPRRRLAA